MHVFRLQSLERSVHSWFDSLSVIVAYDGKWRLEFVLQHGLYSLAREFNLQV